MNAKRLKELLANVDDDTDIFIRNSVNPIGNMQELAQVEESTYGFFGSDVDCIILNTESAKNIETQNCEIIDSISTK